MEANKFWRSHKSSTHARVTILPKHSSEQNTTSKELLQFYMVKINARVVADRRPRSANIWALLWSFQIFRLRNNILHIKELRIKLEKGITLKFNEKDPSCTHFKLVTLSLERKKNGWTPGRSCEPRKYLSSLKIGRSHFRNWYHRRFQTSDFMLSATRYPQEKIKCWKTKKNLYCGFEDMINKLDRFFKAISTARPLLLIRSSQKADSPFHGK